MTEIAYVLSPDWDHYLFTSLHTLFQSGSSFDRIKIYCVGERPNHWNFSDSRIVVEEVAPRSETYFFLNKTYATESDAERVIYLDSDTLILQPLDRIWRHTDSDFIGRVAVGYYRDTWNQQQWIAALEHVGAHSIVPYFNAGFFILQNGSQQKLSPLYQRFTHELRDGEIGYPGPRENWDWYSEQIALSLAVGSANLSLQKLSSTDHAFGWGSGDSFEDAIVYHTGGPSFFLHALQIDRALDLRFDTGFLANQSATIKSRIQRQLWYERFKLVAKRALRPLGLTSSARTLLHRARSLLSI